jgi:putative membrane protein
VRAGIEVAAVNGRSTWLQIVFVLSGTVLLFAGLWWWQPSGLQPWLKALHIIAVIAWMAGMLYLPRLFVYHCGAESGSLQSETFKIMERRLLRAIINPAMAATWGFGLWLAFDGGVFTTVWLQLKLGLVLAMSAVHGMLSRWVRDFATDQNQHSDKFFRIINEVPTLLMIAIVFLVVLKPF